MNRTSLVPSVARMLTLSTVPLLTYLGVTQYNELNKVELPELPIVKEVEPEIIQSSQPQKKIRRVWRQTKGAKLSDWFTFPKGTYSNTYLANMCNNQYRSGIPSIFRNWCNQAKFEIKEEEV